MPNFFSLRLKSLALVKAPLFLVFASCSLGLPFAAAQGTGFASGASLPDAPVPDAPVPAAQPVAEGPGSSAPSPERLSVLATPKRVLHDELGVITSPAHLHTRDLVWLLPLAGATAASLSTDTRTMRDVVSRDAGFNDAASTSSNGLIGVMIGVPAVLFVSGQYLKNDRAREAGLLAGEAMIDAYVTSEGIKYITLRERPNLQQARGHFFAGDAASDPSFVSSHSIVAWSSAAVLAGEYTRPWQQIGIYTLATGVSLSRVLAQQHFPTDALLGSAAGWLIGRYVYRTHHRAAR